ncbi:expressed unknown protein [Seminavis robusta]|uniref:Uncharacterized protein n=1 Tax=Seminavis robusta TaxID=568900 RepID=A0A9N8HUW6_9STRA|nr:expressed unknown protein [Seminavis robusta]|eukprot:Sro1823_g299910.1 n/a (172) ;mRNA; r:10086-10601
MLPHLSPSGEVSFIPQQHTLCAFCRTSFLMCQCTGLEYGKDFVFVGLPPPPANATRAMLLMRWVSLVRMSRSMGSFNGGRWYNDNFKQLNASMNARTALLNEMMDEYVAQLPTDTLRASLAEVLGLENGPMTEQVKGIASEAWASLRIFLSGDWALGLHVLFGYLTLEECF